MLPNSFTELANLLHNGATIDVECREKCEDLESYPEAGMRLTVTGAHEDRDGVINLEVSYAKYEEVNQTFESHNYYDKNSVACLNARQAGHYKVNDTLYVMNTDNPNDYFIPLEDSANRWIRAYLRNRHTDETYVAYLERTLTAALDSQNDIRTYFNG